MSVAELFEKHKKSEFLKFERIPEPQRRHVREDICAFIYLHEKLGGRGNIISGTQHDEIFLNYSEEEAEGLSEEDVIYLVRCGVRLADYGLCMFV